MLPEEVHADVHQFDGIEGAAAAFRRDARVRRYADEAEPRLRIGQAEDLPGHGHRVRVPAQRHVDVVEHARAHHERLAGRGLLRRAPVVAHAPREPPLPRLDPRARSPPAGAGAQQVVPAPVPGTGLGAPRPGLGDPGLLVEAGEGVVLAEDRDHRAAGAALGDERGRQARRCLRRPRSRAAARPRPGAAGTRAPPSAARARPRSRRSARRAPAGARRRRRRSRVRDSPVPPQSSDMA